MNYLGLISLVGATHVLTFGHRGGLPLIFRGDSGDTGFVAPPFDLGEISPDSLLIPNQIAVQGVVTGAGFPPSATH